MLMLALVRAPGPAPTRSPSPAHPTHPPPRAPAALQASQHIEHSTDPSLAALRPLMLEHLVSCRLPQPVKPPPPRPHARPLASLPLLPELAALLNQMVFRSGRVPSGRAGRRAGTGHVQGARASARDAACAWHAAPGVWAGLPSAWCL